MKVDQVGRVRTPPEKREAMLAEYDRSRGTVCEVCWGEIFDADVLGYRGDATRASKWQLQGKIIRVGWKREWREKSRSQRTSWWKWEVGSACLWATPRRPRWRASFSGRWDWAGMLSFSGSLRVFVAVEACDMRRGFEGHYRELPLPRYRSSRLPPRGVHQASLNDKLASQGYHSRGLGENFTLLCNGNRCIARTITVRVAAMTSTVQISELCQYGPWRDAYVKNSSVFATGEGGKGKRCISQVDT